MQGLVPILNEMFPTAVIRYCARHFYANFKMKHKGQLLKEALWKVIKSSTTAHYNAAMDEILAADKEAHNWLMKHPPVNWCRAFFNPYTRCDHVTNNLCEAWNKIILKPRRKPILTCMEDIRRMIMTRIASKREKMINWKGKV